MCACTQAYTHPPTHTPTPTPTHTHTYTRTPTHPRTHRPTHPHMHTHTQHTCRLVLHSRLLACAFIHLFHSLALDLITNLVQNVFGTCTSIHLHLHPQLQPHARIQMHQQLAVHSSLSHEKTPLAVAAHVSQPVQHDQPREWRCCDNYPCLPPNPEFPPVNSDHCTSNFFWGGGCKGTCGPKESFSFWQPPMCFVINGCVLTWGASAMLTRTHYACSQPPPSPKRGDLPPTGLQFNASDSKRSAPAASFDGCLDGVEECVISSKPPTGVELFVRLIVNSFPQAV